MRPQLTLLVVIRALRIRGFSYQPSLFSLLQDSKYKGTEYYNFVVNIPNEIIEKPPDGLKGKKYHSRSTVIC